MQPSGLLHLGNLMGALDNWRKLQDEYECYYFIADWHALTTNYADTSKIRTYVREMVIDWLAAGLDPEKCVLFQQSHLPEHAVLHVLFSMITPLPWLERVPDLQGEDGADPGPGHEHLRFPGLPRAPGRRHPHLQGGLRARGQSTSCPTWS